MATNQQHSNDMEDARRRIEGFARAQIELGRHMMKRGKRILEILALSDRYDSQRRDTMQDEDSPTVKNGGD